MNEEKYERFEPGKQCDATLPLNTIKDEFTIVRFAPLVRREGERTHPVVIPRDVVNPEVMQQFLNQPPDLPYKVDPIDLRGGLPLNVRKWKNWVTPPPSLKIRQVLIRDRIKFLNKPKITINGKTHRIDLGSRAVDELIRLGKTVAVFGKADSKKVVELLFKPQRDDLSDPKANQLNVIQIKNLYEFLKDPKVRVQAGAFYKAAVTERNIEELTSVGISKVEVRKGRLTAEVYVTTGDSRVAMEMQIPNGREYVASRSAMAVTSAGMAALGYGGLNVGQDSVAHHETVPQHLNDTISEYVLPNFELVLYLPYRQTWELLGYHRGGLLNCISLGPEEETTIEVFTWDRVTRTREDTSTAEQEGTLEVTFTDKDTTETVKEMTKTSNWKFNLGGEVTIPVKVPIKLNANLEVGDSLNDVDKATHQAVAEAIRKASARIKTTRQSKVTETEESGREERVTRKVKNPNKCRTLNLDYFEILATYQVTTQLDLDQVQICVLTPVFVQDEINRQFLLCHEGALRQVLLSSNTYLPMFDDVRKLEAYDFLCEIKCKPPCPGETNKTSSDPSLGNGQAPVGTGTASDADAAGKKLIQAGENLRKSLGDLNGANFSELCDIFKGKPWIGLFPSKEDDTRWNAAKLKYHRWLYWKIGTDLKPALDVAAQAFLESGEPVPQTANLGPQFGGTLTIVSHVFNNADDAANAIEKFLKDTDSTAGEDFVRVLLGIFRFDITRYVTFVKALVAANVCLPTLLAEVGVDSAGLQQAVQQARAALNTYRNPQGSAPTTPPTPAKTETTDVMGQAANEYSDREIAEARVSEEALLCHVKGNESYYRQAIWQLLDPNDRLVYLSALGNLPEHVNNEVLGFVGDKAALPFRTADSPEIKAWFKTNVLKNPPKMPDPIIVTLPTKGVMMEARLGKCDTCEDFIMKHRDLDLRQKEAEVETSEHRRDQEEIETERYRKRLDQKPPLLDDPDPNANAPGELRVTLLHANDTK